MTTATEWTPPNCKHGARPIIEQEFMDWNYGTYMGMIPTRKSLHYDCPSPFECVEAAMQGRQSSELAARQAEQLLTGQEA